MCVWGGWDNGNKIKILSMESFCLSLHSSIYPITPPSSLEALLMFPKRQFYLFIYLFLLIYLFIFHICICSPGRRLSHAQTNIGTGLCDYSTAASCWCVLFSLFQKANFCFLHQRKPKKEPAIPWFGAGPGQTKQELSGLCSKIMQGERETPTKWGR